eukprot:Nk52_evm87s164 gene=Nk52_evmTU87s164
MSDHDSGKDKGDIHEDPQEDLFKNSIFSERCLESFSKANKALASRQCWPSQLTIEDEEDFNIVFQIRNSIVDGSVIEQSVHLENLDTFHWGNYVFENRKILAEEMQNIILKNGFMSPLLVAKICSKILSPKHFMADPSQKLLFDYQFLDKWYYNLLNVLQPLEDPRDTSNPAMILLADVQNRCEQLARLRDTTARQYADISRPGYVISNDKLYSISEAIKKTLAIANEVTDLPGNFSQFMDEFLTRFLAYWPLLGDTNQYERSYFLTHIPAVCNCVAIRFETNTKTWCIAGNCKHITYSIS